MMNENIEPMLVDIKSLEKILSLSRRSIYRLISKGTLKPLKNIHGRNYLFDRDEIIKLIKKK